MAMEEEDLSASVIFFGIFFPGNGHVFISTASNYKAEHSNSCTFKCVMLSTKGTEFFVNIKSLKGNSKWKLSFHKEMYGNSAILYRLVKGFSHYFVVFKLLVKLAWCQKLVDIGSIFYTGFYKKYYIISVCSRYAVKNMIVGHFETYFCQP